MAAQEDGVSRAHDGVSIALLRRVRAGEEIPYVHFADVCSAAPADLVANLMPAPGTAQTDDDGYNSIWYFYCPKRYKNTKGEESGHRHRAIDTGVETRWHPEVAAKNVRGSDGGTFCTFSYGRTKDGSLERLRWCMVEYDFVDKQAANTAAAAASSYVLCKVYRPSHGKGKPSSSSSKSSATSSCSKRKRKAGNGNPEARPTKLMHIQRENEQAQMQNDYTFTSNYDYQMPCYEHQHIDYAMFARQEEIVQAEYGPMPYAAAPEHNGEFVQTEYGPMPSQLAQINVDDWIGCQEMFGADEEQGLQQPSAEMEKAREFVQMACGLVIPVVAESTVEDLLGPETVSGESVSIQPPCIPPLDDDFFVGVQPECLIGAQEKATTQPSSSHTPSWSMAPSSPTGCSRLVQEQEPPLWLPCLMCP